MGDVASAHVDGPPFLALGDSYTIGEGCSRSERWPNQLATMLRSRGVAIADPLVVAQTGWTTRNLMSAMDKPFSRDDDRDTSLSAPPAFALVTLLIGVNNQYQGRSEQEYAEQFAAILQRAIGFAGERPSRVIVVSIPDWGVTSFAYRCRTNTAAVARAIDRFNAIKQAQAQASGVHYVDITPISRSISDQVVSDGLHPNALQYAAWMEAVLPAAIQALVQLQPGL